ncbi:uncharacterized protein LOC129585585 [Paramacrobiotus metropolitanus]|uniref:uncharacterized protein LOC129585585 n=1 Tax=Paramacrobiotus metropolitanus TaxID=2943436 RepID=UPI002445EBA5|nr:uncharacterized protein LOC129585585 [Paramacrobiotus metropolitanus]XP_055334298.1 uncharacterized protein LOC129585585 [Paramacrobiotus metropolitanus]XP_055334299.1 uncharacterized protein LOC129585585 [Paramacrobiotus metropolitanus]XP_055334301.1 uncharacterized protein LOC129585585 [Paramacrobiotus metropolitanus]
MNSDAISYIEKCRQCIMTNIPRCPPPGKLQKTEVDEAWYRVYADFKSPLPRTETKGYQYIAVATAQLTKFSVARATKTNTARVFERFFVKDVLLKYGMPTFIHSDKETHFTAWVAQIIGIQHTLGTAHHPEGQGQVERQMQTVWNGIRNFCDVKDGHRWHRVLDYVVCGMNRAVHAATKFSPLYMLYGREMTMPQDIVAGTNTPRQPRSSSRSNNSRSATQTLLPQIENTNANVTANVLAGLSVGPQRGTEHRPIPPQSLPPNTSVDTWSNDASSLAGADYNSQTDQPSINNDDWTSLPDTHNGAQDGERICFNLSGNHTGARVG